VTLTLGTIVTAARDRSPWFFRTRAPDAIVARHLSDVQNELIGAAVRRDPQYLAQTANIVLNLDGASAPGVAGAGTTGGVPGVVDSLGNFATTQGTAGALVEANVTSATGAGVYVSGRTVSSATLTTITSTGANRAVNQDVGRVVVLTAGTGLGERREVLSNTIDTWTISTGSDNQQWVNSPDTTTLFDVVAPAYGADDAMTVFTAVPSTTSSTGYLVKVSAQGVPFIDFTHPLVATMDAGVPLPAMQFPLDGTVWYNDGSSEPLHICAADQRFNPPRTPAVYVLGQSLYLTGQSNDGWQDVASIALRYTPIAPAFTALTDTFLLPDHARPALIAKAAAFMAVHVSALPDVKMDPSPHLADSQRAETTFLANVSAAKRGRGLRARDVF
jgi:hypothetical protein